jgi:hypothetical protein
MSGCIVKIWFETDRADHKTAPRFVVVETEMPDFATFCQMVEADRLIGGAILFTRREGDDQIIIGRHPIAFRGSTVMRCELPHMWRYVEGAAT